MKLLLCILSFFIANTYAQNLELMAKTKNKKVIFSLISHQKGARPEIDEVDFGELREGLHIKSETIERGQNHYVLSAEIMVDEVGRTRIAETACSSYGQPVVHRKVVQYLVEYSNTFSVGLFKVQGAELEYKDTLYGTLITKLESYRREACR